MGEHKNAWIFYLFIWAQRHTQMLAMVMNLILVPKYMVSKTVIKQIAKSFMLLGCRLQVWFEIQKA